MTVREVQSYLESSHREPQWECFAWCLQFSDNVLSTCLPVAQERKSFCLYPNELMKKKLLVQERREIKGQGNNATGHTHLQPLPRQTTPQEVHKHVAECFQVIPPTLLFKKKIIKQSTFLIYQLISCSSVNQTHGWYVLYKTTQSKMSHVWMCLCVPFPKCVLMDM